MESRFQVLNYKHIRCTDGLAELYEKCMFGSTHGLNMAELTQVCVKTATMDHWILKILGSNIKTV